MRLVKQYGLPRSGTNALKALIEINFSDSLVFSNYLGNKHELTDWNTILRQKHCQDHRTFGVPDLVEENLLSAIEHQKLMFIINIKEPASWLDSYYRYQRKKFQHKNPDADFPFSHKFVDSALANWLKVVPNWLQFHLDNIQNSVVVHHREMLEGPRRALSEFAEKSRWSLQSETPFLTLDGYARRGTDLQHGAELLNARQHFDRNYHLNNEWRNNMPAFAFERSIETFKDFAMRYPHQKEFFSGESGAPELMARLS